MPVVGPQLLSPAAAIRAIIFHPIIFHSDLIIISDSLRRRRATTLKIRSGRARICASFVLPLPAAAPAFSATIRRPVACDARPLTRSLSDSRPSSPRNGSLTTIMTQEKKTISLAEASKHKSEKDCWLIIHGKVYDVTAFLDEHPGGYDIVVAASGKDGTEDYEEIGHSTTATEMLADYYIGEYEGGDAHPVAETKAAKGEKKGGSGGIVKALLLPLLIVLIAILVVMKN